MSDAACGTYAGRQRHTHEGTVACDPCRKAAADYARERRQNADLRAREKEQEMARQRALVRLARIHPVLYAALYAEELPEQPSLAVTHCKNGHEYTDENTYRSPKGNRRCRTCSRASKRRSRATETVAA